jgi:maleate cis-trans isomerase
LVRAIHALGFSRVAIVAPYMKPLTRLVVTTFEILDRLGLKPVAPRAGALLGGRIAAGATGRSVSP